nr:unnamed protein product [Callosobruchus analis]
MRRQQYATVQSLWAKDPKLLATMVAEDTLADIEKRRQPELPKGDQTFLGCARRIFKEKRRAKPRTKGITRDDGAAQNVSLFRQALKSMKEGKGGTCSILDISKAFDTVPHDALVPALRRLGVAPYIADYVKTRTRIANGHPSNDDPIQIGLKRGVKQGDP